MPDPQKYCESADIARLGVNEDVIEDLSVEEDVVPAIKSSASLMDSYLRKQFTLPITVWGDDLRECCAVLAAWAILSVEGWKPGENPDDHPLKLRWDFWIAWLKDLALGKVTPDVTDTPPPPDPDTGGVGSPTGAFVVSNQERGYQDPAGGAFTGRRK